MKNKFILSIAALGAAISLHAATAVGVIGTPGLAGYAINSTLGTTNSTSQPTNGLYTAAIAAATSETNLVLINPGATPDGDLIVQLTASGTAASTTNIATFVFASSVLPVTITNNVTTGANQTAAPLGVFATYSLALNGTTAVTTNIVMSKASTPAVANGLNIYSTIISNNAGASSLTNYSAVVVQ